MDTCNCICNNQPPKMKIPEQKEEEEEDGKQTIRTTATKRKRRDRARESVCAWTEQRIIMSRCSIVLRIANFLEVWHNPKSCFFRRFCFVCDLVSYQLNHYCCALAFCCFIFCHLLAAVQSLHFALCRYNKLNISMDREHISLDRLEVLTSLTTHSL